MASFWLNAEHPLLASELRVTHILQVREGLHYNPYFVGGAIAMPKMLVDEGTEYDDEEVFASESQQAKVSYLQQFDSSLANPEARGRFSLVFLVLIILNGQVILLNLKLLLPIAGLQNCQDLNAEVCWQP